jgi:hypothetical protein
MTKKSLTKFSGRSHTIAEQQTLPLQLSLDRMLKEITILGAFDFVFFLNNEGLVMAQYTSENQSDEMAVVEISTLLDQIQTILKSNLGMSELKEVMTEVAEGRKLVFRFLRFFDQMAVLVVMVPPRKAYRGIMNRLQKGIVKLEQGIEPVL